MDKDYGPLSVWINEWNEFVFYIDGGRTLVEEHVAKELANDILDAIAAREES